MRQISSFEPFTGDQNKLNILNSGNSPLLEECVLFELISNYICSVLPTPHPLEPNTFKKERGFTEVNQTGLLLRF